MKVCNETFVNDVKHFAVANTKQSDSFNDEYRKMTSKNFKLKLLHAVRNGEEVVKQHSYLHFLWNILHEMINSNAQKTKSSVRGFFSKYDQICSLLLIWSHLLKKSQMENFIFCSMFQLLVSHKQVNITLTANGFKVINLVNPHQ